MTVEELKEYRALVLEKKSITARLADFDETLLQSVRISDMPKGNGEASDPVQKAFEKRQELTDLYLEKIKAIDEKALKIEQAINSLERSAHRTLIREYYMAGKKWWQVAEFLGYSEDRIYQIHREVLKRLQFITV